MLTEDVLFKEILQVSQIKRLDVKAVWICRFSKA